MRRVLSVEDAEDVRSQCMEAVTRHIRTFDYEKEKGGYRNWLRRITLNKILDSQRKRRMRVADARELLAESDRSSSVEDNSDLEWR